MRTAITILAIVAGLLVVLAVAFTRPPTTTSTPETRRIAATAPGGPEPRDQAARAAQGTDEVEPPAATRPAAMAVAPASTQPAPATSPAVSTLPSADSYATPGGLRILPPANPQPVTIGSNRKGSAYKMQAQLTHWGAGVAEISLADYTTTALSDKPYAVVLPVKAPGDVRCPMGARAIAVGDQRLDLQWLESQGPPLWSLEESSESGAAFRLTVADAQGQPLVDVVRRYTLPPGSYDLGIEQRLVNRTGRPLRVVWEQNGPGDAPNDDAAYMGDLRAIVAAYFDPAYDPSGKHIYTKNSFLLRSKLLDERASDNRPFWPNPDLPGKAELVWAAMVNRYFAAVVHRPIEDPAKPVPALVRIFPRVDMEVIGSAGEAGDTRAAVLTLGTGPIELEGNGSADLSLSLYAGPRDSRVFASPEFRPFHFDQLVVYALGCTWCTFQFLAHWLLWFLRFIHDWLVFDWGVAIIVLVLIVRGLLHPLMRRSQVSMARMGKVQAAIRPEVEKLKKKYADDPQKLNQETMRLWREHGLSPFGMAGGCLPMLLQMPIWVALYAMLYYAIDLRHMPAFYGVFQKLPLGERPWAFLADLSSADNFITFPGSGFTLNLWLITLTFAGINVIPLLMAVVTFYQQKLTMPPAADEQQRQQQAMMKWMPLIIPVMLYSAPSGLTLYIVASTFAGIVDSLIVKRHIKREEAAGTLFKKKEAKPGSVGDRFSRWMASKQDQMADMQKRAEQKQKSKKSGRDRT